MNLLLISLLILYSLIMILISFFDRKKIRSYNDYVIAGQKQALPAVFMSLMATIVGASATLGIAAKAEQIGFPAVWWLLSGTFGLLLQAFFISKRLRSYQVRTLPELVGLTAGKKGQKLISLIIAISWIGIIAAQFIAISQILSGILGLQNIRIMIICSGIFVIVYTALGGQLSVVKTDMVQFLVLFCGFLAVFILACIHGIRTPENTMLHFENIRLFNSQFHWTNALTMFFTVGGAYFLGPDILTRNMIAKDGQTARRAVFLGSITVAVFAVMITLIGMEAQNIIAGKANPLVRLILKGLPVPLAALMTLAIISALLSSADTCLINSSAIIAQDILNLKNIRAVKIAVILMGTVSLIIACYGQDIISLLLGAYCIYTPGIVCPLTIAMLCPKHKIIRESIWLLAVACGGITGLLSTLCKGLPVWLPIAGMALSAAVALFSIHTEAD